jgi:hypothetical protein
MIVFLIGLWLGAGLGAVVAGMLHTAKQADLVDRTSYRTEGAGHVLEVRP